MLSKHNPLRQVPSDPFAQRRAFAASAEAKGSGKSFLPQVAGDTIAAMGAGFCVAPIIYAVDRALAENASGQADLVTSFVSSMKELVVKPAEFFGQYSQAGGDSTAPAQSHGSVESLERYCQSPPQTSGLTPETAPSDRAH